MHVIAGNSSRSTCETLSPEPAAVGAESGSGGPISPRRWHQRPTSMGNDIIPPFPDIGGGIARHLRNLFAQAVGRGPNLRFRWLQFFRQQIARRLRHRLTAVGGSLAQPLIGRRIKIRNQQVGHVFPLSLRVAVATTAALGWGLELTMAIIIYRLALRLG